MPPDIDEHVHPLPVCGFGQHTPHAPQCEGRGQLVACGTIVDPLHPHFGKALCWHRAVDADPEVGAEPDAEPEPVDEADPVDEPLAPEEGSEPLEPQEPSDTPDPADSEPDTGDTGTPESDAPLPEGDGGDTPDPPEDRTGCLWWLKYFWLLPLILPTMGLIALLAKILKALGGFAGLVALLERLRQALRDFLDGFPDTPPEGDGTPEDPDPDEDEDPTDQACELVAEPRLTLGERWVLPNADNQADWVHLAHEFEIRAEFAQHCKCCEYQQEIMGYFRVRHTDGEWEDRELLLPRGRTLRRDGFEIDGKRNPYFEYGRRRGQENRKEDEYLPERDDGCEYIGSDLPGLRGLKLGDSVDIDLTFRGRVIDRCNGRILWERTWRLHTWGYIDRKPPTQPGRLGDFVYIEGALPGATTPGTPTGGTATPGTGGTPTGGTTTTPGTGGTPAGGPTGTLHGVPENLPWKSTVSDDDPCQPVKEQGMGGILISCHGRCVTGGPCRLEKRPAGSTQNWRPVPDSLEVASPGYEYRCRC